MSILPLPDAVVAQIKSSLVVTSLSHVACGLLKNSLDAGATKIQVSIDYTRGNCSVEDNGDGIPPPEFREDGGLGKLHYTSKHTTEDTTYGKRGEFIASAASISLLSVTSHHRNSRSHNSMKIHNSEVIARDIPALPEQRLLTFDHGTRVTVRDLFGSMPVRAKQRPSASNLQRDWLSLLRSVSGILLSWPATVSVGLRCSVTNQTVTLKLGDNTHKSVSGKALALPSKVPTVLWQAGIFESPQADPWVPLTARSTGISVHGCISLLPSASKRCQFISLGLEPVQNESGTNVLYNEINAVFSNSGFGIEESSDIEEEERSRRAKDKRFKTERLTNQALKIRKGVDRWPMFYMQINLDQSGDRYVNDILDERRPTLHRIIDLLRATLFEFLRKNHFRPRKVRTKNPRANKSGSRGESQMLGMPTSSHGKMARPALKHSDSLFDVWTIAKSGQPGLRSSKVDSRSASRLLVSTAEQRESSNSPKDLSLPLIGPSGHLSRAPFADPQDRDGNSDNNERIFNAKSNSAHSHQDRDIETGTIMVENPVTHTMSIVDKRTGFARSTEGGATRSQASRILIPQSSSGSPALQANISAPWIDKMLANFENPVFENVAREDPIPTLFNLASCSCGGGDLYPTGSSSGHGGLATVFKTATAVLESRVSRAALRDAEVLAQVDGKYILAKVKAAAATGCAADGEAGLLVVVVDQHAADERRRVEALMREYHGPDGRAVAVPVDPGVHFDVPDSSEAELFARFRDVFASWGVRYQLVASASSFFDGREGRKGKAKSKGKEKGKGEVKCVSTSSVVVVGLPPSISERCKTEPKLLIELLRKEIHLMEEGWVSLAPPGLGNGPGRCQDGRSENGKGKGKGKEQQEWLSRFHGCPKGILEMVNSRACRSAIMFNDPLSMEECKDLVHGLAECVLPFQCAHGRPSMVPLVGLAESFGDISQDESGVARIMAGDEQILACELVMGTG